MTESDWNRCSDSQAMLDFLQGKASDRKLRLFTCAYCRTIVQESQAVQVAERFADGLATNAERKHARKEAVKAATRRAGWGGINNLMAVADTTIARILCPPGRIYRECGTLPRTFVRAVQEVNRQAADELQQAQVMLLRDIFGNPFQPLAPINPSLLTPTIVAFAQTIYEERSFERVRELGNALEEAGCTDVELLGHLRADEPHVRGCFALDAVLGKS